MTPVWVRLPGLLLEYWKKEERRRWKEELMDIAKYSNHLMAIEPVTRPRKRLVNARFYVNVEVKRICHPLSSCLPSLVEGFSRFYTKTLPLSASPAIKWGTYLGCIQ